jgi:hypothetical protein
MCRYASTLPITNTKTEVLFLALKFIRLQSKLIVLSLHAKWETGFFLYCFKHELAFVFLFSPLARVHTQLSKNMIDWCSATETVTNISTEIRRTAASGLQTREQLEHVRQATACRIGLKRWILWGDGDLDGILLNIFTPETVRHIFSDSITSSRVTSKFLLCTLFPPQSHVRATPAITIS